MSMNEEQSKKIKQELTGFLLSILPEDITVKDFNLLQKDIENCIDRFKSKVLSKHPLYDGK